MGAEHLGISGYDDLSEEDILAKLELLRNQGREADLEAIASYEESNQGRQAIVDKAREPVPTQDEAVDPQAVPPEATPQGESKPGPTTPSPQRGLKAVESGDDS